MPLQSFVDGLVVVVERFTDGAEQGDDRTILAVNIR